MAQFIVVDRWRTFVSSFRWRHCRWGATLYQDRSGCDGGFRLWPRMLQRLRGHWGLDVLGHLRQSQSTRRPLYAPSSSELSTNHSSSVSFVSMYNMRSLHMRIAAIFLNSKSEFCVDGKKNLLLQCRLKFIKLIVIWIKYELNPGV